MMRDMSLYTKVAAYMKQKISDAYVVGGIGEKKSNGGSQYYQQDRVYSGGVLQCAILTHYLLVHTAI